MAFFEQLREETRIARECFLATPLLQAGLRGEIGRGLYVRFLSQAYHHVKHTVPLLMACGSRLPDRLGRVRVAVAEYIREEIGHEEWILNDIKAAGGDAEMIRRSHPGAAAEIMVAYAYHVIERGNPAGFLGMVHVLEGSSVAMAGTAARAIQKQLGLPDAAFTYLLSHGSLDQEHVVFFENLVNSLDEDEDRAAIIHCARIFYQLYGAVFDTLPQLDI